VVVVKKRAGVIAWRWKKKRRERETTLEGEREK